MAEAFVLLAGYAAQVNCWLLTFRHSLSSLNSRVKQTFIGGTDTLCRKVCYPLPTYCWQQPRRGKASRESLFLQFFTPVHRWTLYVLLIPVQTLVMHLIYTCPLILACVSHQALHTVRIGASKAYRHSTLVRCHHSFRRRLMLYNMTWGQKVKQLNRVMINRVYIIVQSNITFCSVIAINR